MYINFLFLYFVSINNRLDNSIYHDITLGNGNITLNLGNIYNYFLHDYINFAILSLGTTIFVDVITIYI